MHDHVWMEKNDSSVTILAFDAGDMEGGNN